MKMIIGNLLLAVILLSLKTGFILGSSWLPLRWAGGISALFGGSVVFLSWLFKDNYLPMIQLIDRYTFVFACIAGFLFLYLGLQQPHRVEEMPGKKGVKYWVGFLPCPLCAGALTVSVIYTANYFHWGMLRVAVVIGLSFALCTFVVAWLARGLLSRLGFDPIRVFHQCLLLLGCFTLSCAFLIPNIVAGMSTSFLPVAVESPRALGLTVLGFSALFFLGFLKGRFNNGFIFEKKVKKDALSWF